MKIVYLSKSLHHVRSSNTCIVVPPYNEVIGIVIKEYATFLENYPTTMICFVNDGSTDNT
jgi:hypothetical protein